MIKYTCPKCQESLQAEDNRLGAISPCPKCNSQVQVPVVKGPMMPALLGFAGGAGTMVIGCLLCGGLFALLGVGTSTMGKNSTQAFSTVGASIGSVTGS